MNFGMNNTTSTALFIPVHIPGLRILIAFSCIIIYLFGYTGCLLSIITFSSKKLRRHSTGFLFLIMAFVDICNLFASLQYFLDVLYQINVFQISIHWCRFFTIFNYELYFAFSWIFVFISLDRWIKVEWPTRSQTLCTREKFSYLCVITLIISLLQNLIYTILCFDVNCEQKHLSCEIFIHIIYIIFYMVVPIAIILISICRTCLITINLKKRFRTSAFQNQQQEQTSITHSMSLQLETIAHCNSTTFTTRVSNSFVSSPSSTPIPTANYSQIGSASNNRIRHNRRRSRLDGQMVVLLSINVAPFILVHIVTEIAYLFERYSSFVAGSTKAKLIIIFIYLSWYLISATRFYTNCLLSRIYREEFKNRLYMLKNRCTSQSTSNERMKSRRHSSRYCTASMMAPCESTILNIK